MAAIRRRQAGFTLVELVVSIIIIGILSVVAYPRLNTDGFDEVGFRDQVSTSLAFARKAAVAQRRNVKVSLSGNTFSFLIANDVPEGPGALTFTRSLVLPGVGSAQFAPRGKATVTGPAAMTFSPVGAASATSYVYTITGASARTVTVDPLTGYAN